MLEFVLFVPEFAPFFDVDVDVDVGIAPEVPGTSKDDVAVVALEIGKPEEAWELGVALAGPVVDNGRGVGLGD